jgi:hypothetical protein
MIATLHRFVLAFFVAAGLAPAQGQFVPFGQGCAFGGATCAIGNQGLPQVGQRFVVTYSGPNAIQPFPRPGLLDMHPHLVLGLGQTTTPIPALLPQQPVGCTGLITADAVLPAPRDLLQVPPRNYAPVTLAVPPAPALTGTVLYAQWLTVLTDSGTGSYEALLVSDAAVLVVG